MSAAHREGINLRHLGRVRRSVSGPNGPALRCLLLTECVARTLKNLVRKELRDYAAHHSKSDTKGKGFSANEVVFHYLASVLFYQSPFPRYLAVSSKEERNYISEQRLMLDTRIRVSGWTTATFDSPLAASNATWFCEFFLERMPVRFPIFVCFP